MSSFSFLLAKRYLNPLRTHLSAITIISLLGVAVGVLVLVVVLAVMGGFEREIKTRILAYSPHILVQPYAGQEGELWDEAQKEILGREGVENVYPFIEDFVLISHLGLHGAGQMRGIDTRNEEQFRQLESMLKEGSFDLGLDQSVVVSEVVARNYHLSVGDELRVFSQRNSEAAIAAYEQSERQPVFEEFADDFALLEQLTSEVESKGEEESLSHEALIRAYNQIVQVYDQNLRPGEKEILFDILSSLELGKDGPEEGLRVFPIGTMVAIDEQIALLKNLDYDYENSRCFSELKEVVLPKDLKVIGIYRASDYAPSPAIFVPIPTAEELTGLEPGQSSYAIHLTDPYQAGEYRESLKKTYEEDGVITAWMDQHKMWFTMIRRQEFMMDLVLSIIIVVAAFCIGAVMFTVTIQKQKEIGVMKAMGATPRQIQNVFAYQGMIIGAIGVILGLGGAILLLAVRTQIQTSLGQIGMDPFPSDFYGTDEIPVHYDWVKNSMICLFAFLACVLAAWLPAWMASRKDPARSLRAV